MKVSELATSSAHVLRGTHQAVGVHVRRGNGGPVADGQRAVLVALGLGGGAGVSVPVDFEEDIAHARVGDDLELDQPAKSHAVSSHAIEEHANSRVPGQRTS